MNTGKLVFAQVTRAFAADDVSPLRGALRRRAQGQKLFLSRSVSLHGVRPTDLSRELARHRSVPARASRASSTTWASRAGCRAAPWPMPTRVRDWRIYADFAQSLIAIARRLYADEPFGVDLKETVYALDASTIDLCLSVFPWAPFRSTKAAIKLHTLLDLRGNIPSFLHISDGKLHDVNVLDLLLPEPGAFYIMDRGYIDFERLYRLHEASSFFVTRAKSNLKAQRRYSHPVDRSTGLICDQTIVLTGFYSRQDFDTPLRRIRFKDPDNRQAAGVSHQQLRPAGDSPSPSSIAAGGRSSCFSNGSSSIFVSKSSSAPPRTRSKLKSGSRSRFTCSSPSSKSDSTSRPACMKCYRS